MICGDKNFNVILELKRVFENGRWMFPTSILKCGLEKVKTITCPLFFLLVTSSLTFARLVTILYSS